jgi:hypothetical protein
LFFQGASTEENEAGTLPQRSRQRKKAKRATNTAWR